MHSSRGSSQPRDQTWVSCITGGFFFTTNATLEAHHSEKFQVKMFKSKFKHLLSTYSELPGSLQSSGQVPALTQ